MDGCCVPTDGYHAPAPVAGEGGGSVTRRGGTSRIDTTVNSGTEWDAGQKAQKQRDWEYKEAVFTERVFIETVYS